MPGDVSAKKAAADKKKAELMKNIDGKKKKVKSKKKDKKSQHVEKTVYDWDCIMLFPLATKDKPNSKNTKERYANTMAGIKKWRKADMIDNSKQIFRTDRCYLTDDNIPEPKLADIAKRADEEENQVERAKITNERIAVVREALEAEFVTMTGSSDPCSDKMWRELVIKSVCRRIQLACGLTVAMKESIDGDEVIMCIQADENDLKIEADRTDYKVQLHNKPFGYANEDDSAQSCSHFTCPGYLMQLKKQNPEAFEKAKQRLIRTCDENGEVLDPALTRKGLQQDLFKYMKKMDHREEFSEHDMKNRFKHLLPKYSTYIAPYDEYRMDDEYQPFFRHYLTKTGESSVFRNVDRVRLTTSILERHINLGYLEVGKFMVDFFPMHDADEVEWFKRNWVFNAAILPFPGAETQPIGAIRNYYGEKVALYFAWLEHYSRALFFPTVLGILFTVFQVFGNTHSHTHTLTHSRTHALTHSHTHALTHSHTHTLTPPLCTTSFHLRNKQIDKPGDKQDVSRTIHSITTHCITTHCITTHSICPLPSLTPYSPSPPRLYSIPVLTTLGPRASA
jgi:hypothetical protein